jgi:hypothetical protein
MKFTQFLRPDGRKQEVFIDRSPEIEAMALECVQAGVRFEAEVLTTGEVSLTAQDDELDEPLAHEIVPNGPGVPEAVDRLVRATHKHVGTVRTP